MVQQLPIVGAGAALTVLVAVIGLLLRANASDRRDYWARLEVWRLEYDKATVAWQVRLDAADAATARCQEAVDAERKERRRVEDATYRELIELRAEVARLRAAVTGQSDERPRP